MFDAVPIREGTDAGEDATKRELHAACDLNTESALSLQAGVVRHLVRVAERASR